MNTLLPKAAIGVAIIVLLTSRPIPGQVSQTTPKAARVRIIQGPEIEINKALLTIIRWTTDYPRRLARALRRRPLRYRS